MFTVIEAVKAHPEVWPFITPVEETYAPAYFDYVKVRKLSIHLIYVIHHAVCIYVSIVW